MICYISRMVKLTLIYLTYLHLNTVPPQHWKQKILLNEQNWLWSKQRNWIARNILVQRILSRDQQIWILHLLLRFSSTGNSFFPLSLCMFQIITTLNEKVQKFWIYFTSDAFIGETMLLLKLRLTFLPMSPAYLLLYENNICHHQALSCSNQVLVISLFIVIHSKVNWNLSLISILHSFLFYNCLQKLCCMYVSPWELGSLKFSFFRKLNLNCL